MFSAKLAFLSALCVGSLPGPAAAERLATASQAAAQQPEDVGRAGETGGQSYGDRNRGGRSGFYSYPRHRHVDDGSAGGVLGRPLSSLSAGTSPYCDTVNCHGSAWYGRDYGAPYFGGGYVDRGTYYRERRDR